MRIDFDRRVLRRCRRAIVALASEKARVTHEDSHGFRGDELGLVGAQIWALAFDGLHRSAKPVAFIEDAAVRPAQLPEYVRGLRSIMKPLGLEASYYGHAASGLLHVRPVLDLHSATDLKKFRQVADQTSALVRQFKGSLSAEHGVGIARTEYIREQLGDDLLEVMRAIKNTFDPKNIFNPGKILEVGS